MGFLRAVFVLVLMSCFANLKAQVLSSYPYFPSANDTVTIHFNAALGNEALFGYNDSVYAYTGVITNKSANLNDWKYIKGSLSQPTISTLMKRIAPNLYEIKFHIRSFYGVPTTDTILNLAFFFRDKTGNYLGKEEFNATIYQPIYTQGSFNARIFSPFRKPDIQIISDTFEVFAAASQNAQLKIFINNQLVATEANKDSIIAKIPTANYGKYKIRFEAKLGAVTIIDSAYSFVKPAIQTAIPPANWKPGINILSDTSVGLLLFAPQKTDVFAIGDFNNWELDTLGFMFRSPDFSNYWIQINGLKKSQEYRFQYLVDQNLKIGDPYSRKVLDPNYDAFISAANYPNLIPYPYSKTTGIASVFSTDTSGKYNWKNSFSKPKIENLVIYELLVRDFSNAGNFNSLLDSLNYLKNLGVNCIQLLPVMEFDRNDTRGYNTSYFFANDKMYGRENDFKQFVDSCHAKGIAVVLDFSLNHVSENSPLARLYWDENDKKPSFINPYLNREQRHENSLGPDVNHSSIASKLYFNEVFKYWIQNYRIDGIRFDRSKGYTQNGSIGNLSLWAALDTTRVKILSDYAKSIKAMDSTVYLILDHYAVNTEEKMLADSGFLILGNLNYFYNQAAMGWTSSSDFSNISYKQRGFKKPRVVGYMESHDEERMMYKNIYFGRFESGYSTRDMDEALNRMALCANFFFTIPGPKLMYQFQELGYDFSVSFNGKEGKKPVVWNYTQSPRRAKLMKVNKALIDLKLKEQAFQTDSFSIDLASELKKIRLYHSTMDVVVLGNFDVRAGQINPEFTKTGKWYNFYKGDSITVTNPNALITLQPGEYRIYTTKRLPKPDLNVNVAIQELVSNTEINLHSNPSNGEQVLTVNSEVSGLWSLELVDISGRMIFSQTMNLQAGQNQMRLFSEVWKSTPKNGIYLLKISSKSNGYSAIKKVIID